MPRPDRSRPPRLQPVLFVGGETERDGTGLGDQHHLFELDTVGAAYFDQTNQALKIAVVPAS